MLDCLELIGEIVAVHFFPKDFGLIQIPYGVVLSSIDSRDVHIGISAENDKKSNSKFVHFLKSTASIQGMAIDTYYINRTDQDPRLIIEQGASVKESGKRSIPGVAYTTKLSAKSYEDISKIRDLVNAMYDCEYYDTLIVDIMDRVFLLRGIEPACELSMSSVLPVVHQQSIDLEVVSINGLIPVTFADE